MDFTSNTALFLSPDVFLFGCCFVGFFWGGGWGSRVWVKFCRGEQNAHGVQFTRISAEHLIPRPLGKLSKGAFGCQKEDKHNKEEKKKNPKLCVSVNKMEAPPACCGTFLRDS